MKKLFNYFGIALLASTMFLASCSDDPTPGSPIVGNGVFVVGDATSTTATGDYQLEAARIDKFPDAVDRAGLVEGYVFLKAGTLTLEKYVNGTATILGGSVEERDLNDNYKMYVGTVEADGAAITVPEAGLYHVSYDDGSALIVMVPVKTFGIIGSATPDGWAGDTELPISSSSESEVVFQKTEVVMAAGEWKLRYDNNWSIDLTTDAEELILFSNFGGAVDALEAGGANMAFDAAGIYTITATYTPGAGNSIALSAEKTGDIAFDPAEYPWALIGNATVTGWEDDSLLNQDGAFWWLAHTLSEGTDANEFKFRVGDWEKEIKPENGSAASTFDEKVVDGGNGNFKVEDGGAGFYYTSLATSDDGATWDINIQKFTPEIIGAATVTGWDSGTPATFSEENPAGTYTWTMTDVVLTAADFKFRVNADWKMQANFNNSTIEGAKGGQITKGEGDNFSATADTYQITITTSDYGLTYTLTFE